MLLAPQFEMYNNQIRLSTFEKLNTLERETVCWYRKKLTEQEEKLQLLQ